MKWLKNFWKKLWYGGDADWEIIYPPVPKVDSSQPYVPGKMNVDMTFGHTHVHNEAVKKIVQDDYERRRRDEDNQEDVASDMVMAAIAAEVVSDLLSGSSSDWSGGGGESSGGGASGDY